MHMNAERALEILAEVFLERVDASSPTWSAQVQLSFYDEPPTARMTVYHGEEMGIVAEQPVTLLPSDTDIDADRYRAFAEGVRASVGAHVARYEGMTGPAEVVLTDLLRDPSLRTAADFGAAIADDDVQARVLGPIQVGDFARKHGLAPLADDVACRRVWSILREQGESDEAARGLSEAGSVETIPYLVALADAWVDSGFVNQPVWFLHQENGHCLLARLLEPLLRRTADPDLTRRVEGLAEAGLFD